MRSGEIVKSPNAGFSAPYVPYKSLQHVCLLCWSEAVKR